MSGIDINDWNMSKKEKRNKLIEEMINKFGGEVEPLLTKEQELIKEITKIHKQAKKFNMTIDEYFEYLKNKEKLNKLRR